MQELLDAINESETPLSMTIPVTIFADDPEKDLGADNIEVTFDVLMDYRSWGIKDFALVVKNPISFAVFSTETGDDTGQVDIPLDSLEYSYRKGGYWGIEDLDVALNADGSVKDATLNCVYAAPPGE